VTWKNHVFLTSVLRITEISGRFSPTLRALQTLEAVVRHGSLTCAAKELGVSVSAVSFQLKEMDQALGRRLVAREGRGLRIDPIAAELAAQMYEPFRQLQSTVARLRRPPQPECVTVAMLPSFAAVWFLPRLPRFTAANPDIDVQVITGSRLIDFDLEPVNCAVRSGAEPWPGLDCEPLFEQVFAPIASRSHLDQAGMPQGPAELSKMRLIITEGRAEEWHEWMELSGISGVDELTGHRVDSRDLALQAVEAGLGIGLLDLSLISDRLRTGQLIQLFPVQLRSGWRHWFVTPAGMTNHRVDRLRRWIQSEAAIGRST
jgi:LysR family glycine cleavage system transcriptional activator